MKYAPKDSPLHHVYSGGRTEVDTLIAWLMDKDYWLEAHRPERGGEWAITCGVDPDTVQRLASGVGVVLEAAS